MNETLPLRTYRLAPRKARLERHGTLVHAYLPAYFGRRRVEFDAAQSAVAHQCTLPDEADDEAEAEAEQIVFERAITLPYLFTTSPAAEPNLMVLFTAPMRVPPLRALMAMSTNLDLPFGFFSTRSASGVAVDGLMLCAVAPHPAVEWLRAAGASVATDPEVWLAEHRAIVVDEADRKRLIEKDRRADRFHNASWNTRALGCGAIFGASHSGGHPALQVPLFVLGGVSLIAAGALFWARRRLTQ